MPARARAKTATTNRVAAAQVPPLMSKGRISWSLSLEQQGSGAIEYESVQVDTFSQLRSIFRVGNRYTWYGIRFEISNFGYTRNKVYPNDSLLELFDVNVSLQQLEEDVEEYTLTSTGGSWTFSNAEILQDGEVSEGLFEGGYNQAELTFGDGSGEGEEETPPGEPRTIFRLKQSRTEEFVEGDTEAGTSGPAPPPNTYVLRDTTSNFDESGPKKMVKRSFRRDGQLERETLTTYGFAYLMRQIHTGDGTLYNDSPEQFWQPIEYKETQYYYQRIGPVAFNVVVTPPGVPGAAPVRFVIHPDYAQFVGTSLIGSQISIQSNAEYLIKQITTGWKLVRFRKEEQDRNSLFPDDPYAPMFEFRRIPFYAENYYGLRNSRREFGDTIALPFRIEWQDYATLPEIMKTAFARQDITPDGKVAVLYPDPNYVEPMFISSEASFACSFAWVMDPDADDPDPDLTIPGTNRSLPPPHLTTGEESYSAVTRLIVSNDRYTEYIVNYSSQDPGFDNSAEQYSFREVSGTPPEPQYRMRQYEATQVSNNSIVLSSSVTQKKYFITTEEFQDRVEEGGSVSVAEAKTLKEAIDKLELDLLKSYLQVSTSNRVIAWFRPQIKPGDRCGFEGDRSRGGWVVTSVSWTLEYNGTNNDVGGMLVTTPGTSITCGQRKRIQIRVFEKEETVPGEGNQNFIDAQVDADVIATPGDIGELFPNLPGRRNY